MEKTNHEKMLDEEEYFPDQELSNKRNFTEW